MSRHAVLSAACLLALASNSSTAQTAAWSHFLYAEIANGASTQTLPLQPYYTGSVLPQRVLQITGAGGAGVVLSGNIDLSDESGFCRPYAPYAVKLAIDDGHELWRWEPSPDASIQGRIWTTAKDSAGNVVLVGDIDTDDCYLGSYLVVKLDAATGAEIWRRVGPAPTRAYGVAVDANDDVVMTASEPAPHQDAGQRVMKLDGATGDVRWSSLLPEGQTDWEDFRLVLDGAGNAIAAGHYITAPPNELHGVQVAKFRASDGMELWRKRSVGDFFSNLTLLDTLSSGDVIIQDSERSFARLSGIDGHTMWQRDGDDAHEATVLTGPGDTLYTAGPPYESSASRIRRINPVSGATLWEHSITDAQSGSYASELTFDTTGRVLVAWQATSSPWHFGVARYDGFGQSDWSASFTGSDRFGSGGLTVALAQAQDGGIFVGGYVGIPNTELSTTLLAKIIAPFSDVVFANGFE